MQGICIVLHLPFALGRQPGVGPTLGFLLNRSLQSVYGKPPWSYANEMNLAGEVLHSR
jgi:hypothetical protein